MFSTTYANQRTVKAASRQFYLPVLRADKFVFFFRTVNLSAKSALHRAGAAKSADKFAFSDARRPKIFAQCFQSLTEVGKEKCQFKDEESKVVTTFPGNFLVKASVWLPHKVMEP